MRTRSLLGAVLLAVALAVTGCGDAGTITKTGGPVANGEASGGSTDDGSVPPEDTGGGTDGTTDGGMGSLPDFGGIEGDECLTASAAMASMMTGLTGGALTPEQQDQIEAARDALPDDVRKDYDKVAGAFEKIQTDGIIAAGEEMSSPEFEAAQKRIEDYLKDVCGG